MDSASAKEDEHVQPKRWKFSGSACSRAALASPAHIVSQCAQLGVAEHVVAERKDALDGGRGACRGGCHREEDAGEAAPRGELGGVGAPEEQHLLRVVSGMSLRSSSTLLNQAAAVLTYAGRSFLRHHSSCLSEKNGRGTENLCSQLLASALA